MQKVEFFAMKNDRIITVFSTICKSKKLYCKRVIAVLCSCNLYLSFQKAPVLCRKRTIVGELLESGKVIEGENIWRAQIIFLASALDFYMHELTKYGLCEI